MIGAGTAVFVSVSARPGRFGASVYAALFEHFGIDAVYIPRPAPAEAREVVDAVRALSISGCSVSSPHKGGVIAHLDAVDAGARAAQSVNTIVRDDDGALTGYSTDVEGVLGALAGAPVRTALIYGGGGVVGATVEALRRLGAERVSICARSGDRARGAAARLGIESVGVEAARAERYDVLVNATPAGRTRENAEEVAGLLGCAGVLLDMPVSAERTYLHERALEMGLEVRDGVEMCVHQIAAQARLYLRRSVALGLVREVVRTAYLGAPGPGRG